MSTITVTVPDEVWERVSHHAAERGLSVAELVVEYLSSTTADTEFRRLERLQDDVLDEVNAFSGAFRLPREVLYREARS